MSIARIRNWETRGLLVPVRQSVSRRWYLLAHVVQLVVGGAVPEGDPSPAGEGAEDAD